jgi:hypothetical protein
MRMEQLGSSSWHSLQQHTTPHDDDLSRAQSPPLGVLGRRFMDLRRGVPPMVGYWWVARCSQSGRVAPVVVVLYCVASVRGPRLDSPLAAPRWWAGREERHAARSLASPAAAAPPTAAAAAALVLAAAAATAAAAAAAAPTAPAALVLAAAAAPTTTPPTPTPATATAAPSTAAAASAPHFPLPALLRLNLRQRRIHRRPLPPRGAQVVEE